MASTRPRLCGYGALVRPVFRRAGRWVRRLFFTQRQHPFSIVVDIKVAKAAKVSKLRGVGGQVGHVEEAVDFSGFG